MILLRSLAAVAVVAIASGCAQEELQPIIVHPTPVLLEARSIGSGGSTRVDGARADVSRIQVLPGKRPDRPAEVIGVVDAHVPMGDHERALAVLKEKAAALGADAVIGVDFEHGEAHDKEPVHLSGLAVRYLRQPVPTE